SMYEVTRVQINGNNKWYFARYLDGFADRDESLCRIIEQYLECFAPATVKEIAYALSLTEEDTVMALKTLMGDEIVVEGKFLISEGDQYMKHIDRMRLKAGSSDVFDFETVERYQVYKGQRFDSIEDFFAFYGSAGSELDVYNRVPGFDLEKWYSMRESGQIRLGRFIRGRVRFVMNDDASKLASLRHEPVTEEDLELLDVIDRMGQATMRQLVAETGLEKPQVKESILRLDRDLRIVHAFSGREDWGTENTYEIYVPDKLEEDPIPYLVEQSVRAYGPIPVMALRYILGIDPDTAVRIATSIGAKTIYVGDGHTPMLVMEDEIPKMGDAQLSDDVIVMSLFDPALSAKWAEISARYGDRWIYPFVRGSSIIGAAEMWEMSGCIEIRSLDLDDAADLVPALEALDRMMGFFKMKGTDIIRIREIKSVDAAELDDETKAILEKAEYRFVNGFYAKGRFITRTFTREEIMSYVIRKQHVPPADRYASLEALVADRGYIRNDSELMARVSGRKLFKKLIGRDEYVKTFTSIPYIGYTTRDKALLYASAKQTELTEEQSKVLQIVRRFEPAAKKDIVRVSPYSEPDTVEALNSLVHLSLVYQDSVSMYSAVDGDLIPKDQAQLWAAKMAFKEFGMFSAEQFSLFMDIRMSVARSLLRKMEDEGYLVKGFLEKDCSTLMWMLAEDKDRKVE
ncbi:MAG: ATP-dependent helicase, partial [Candidatus Methanomethylophilaceae archaeon]|nr:ATP-dependent helicase [Candidatus Methanomethylophilaceae archaeon]